MVHWCPEVSYVHAADSYFTHAMCELVVVPALKWTYLRRYCELCDVSMLYHIASELYSTPSGRTVVVRSFRGADGEDFFKITGWLGSTNKGLHMNR